jgi:hypothetical protein
MEPAPTVVSAPNAPARKSRLVRRLVLAVVLMSFGAAGGIIAGRLWQHFQENRDHTEFHVSKGVVVAVRDLARLEGAEFQVERVVSASDKQARLWGLLEVEDALLLVASGNIVAGVDLSYLKDSDFELDEATRSAKVTLPSSTVFSARLDNDRTYIYRRDTDLLAERRESLETRARQEAEKALLEAAKQEGIVRRSNDSVRRTVESLVKSLGYRNVTVTFREAGELNMR